ncbi:MAG: outer membrane protein transport protein [Desulfobacterales bacterium]|nr:MAG: outer membrane protein transport protein [Desulfobacterales bacterium]
MKKYGFGVFFSILLVILAVGSANAGGLWLYEQATSDMGVGGAGREAAGLDASTAGGKPAAMTRLDRSQMEGGIVGFFPNMKFDVESSTFGGNDGGNAGNFSAVPSLYYVHSLSPDLKLGLGAGSYFGGAVSYSNEWAGKYYVQKGSYTTAAVNPTIGYRVAPWLSVGGGFSVVYGALSERVAVNTLLEPGDGRLKYDDTDIGYGFNLGVLFDLSPQTRVGVTYISHVDLEFKDKLKFKNLDGTILGAALNASGVADDRLKIDTTIPMQLAVGVYHAFNDKFALAASVNWQEWSKFGQPEISVSDENSVTKDLDYKDTFHIGLGVYYRVADPWLLMAGFGYDSSPISDPDDRSPLLPLDETYRYATGVQCDWTKNVSVGAACTLIDIGKAKINRSEGPLVGDLKGEYGTNYVQAFNMNVVYRF